MESQSLGRQLDDAYARKQQLEEAGEATGAVVREIVDLKRKLREGGQLRAGDRLGGDGRYHVLEVLGRGGFATVWKAKDRVASRYVAIKVLHANLAGDPQRRDRFFRGAQAMMKLAHPGVVRVLEPKGEDGGFYYFVMEFVPGGNLHKAVLAQRMQQDDVVRTILRVGDALVVVHASGMVHRDIKPANILLDEHGNAKLTDFDLVGAHDTTGGTRTGAMGTVVYAAPECLHKPQDATARADVFGLGMTAIFCLSGKELTLDTLLDTGEAVARLNCTGAVQKVLRRAVEWKQDSRFADAAAMVDALHDALDGSLQRDQESAASKPSRSDGEPRSSDQGRGFGRGASRASEWDPTTPARDGEPERPPVATPPDTQGHDPAALRALESTEQTSTAGSELLARVEEGEPAATPICGQLPVDADHDGTAVVDAAAVPLKGVLQEGVGAWRRTRRWAYGAVAVAIVGVALIDQPSELNCELATRTRAHGAAVSICEREYRDTRNPAIGVRLADLWRQAGWREEACALATRLLDTPERASALRIQGKIAIDEHRLDDAAQALAAARDLHRTAHDAAGLARDDQALAKVEFERHRFGDSLAVLDECLQQASAAGDTDIEYFCRLAATKVLAEVGDLAVAQRELERAAQLARSDRDRVWLEYEQGNLDQAYVRAPQRSERALRAITAFERAARLNVRAQVPGFQLTLELNLAESLADAGRLDEAERHLALAAMVDPEDEGASPRTEIAAEIALRRGDLARAAQLSQERYDALHDDDEARVRVAGQQARVALAGGDLLGAERWARRGIAAVERIGAEHAAPELRAHVLWAQRTPYELLFVALARAGRLDDAVVALDQWQGRTLPDALVRPSPPSPGLLGAAQRVTELGALLPVLSVAPLGVAADPRQLLAALHTADLLALVVAGRDVWRVTASQGRLDIADLGPFAGLQDALDRFAWAPTEPTLASELGARLLPAAAVRVTSTPLHVLLDESLASLPVVALRRDGHVLIGVRPVVRVLRMFPIACTPARVPNRRTVIADAQSDLPDSRREAAELSSVLGFTAAVGAEATSAALFQAAGSDVLHIAVHAAVGAGGGGLALRDRSVSALEISAARLGPPLVMLSACGSASDAELAGSLAAGFLAAGSDQVVAMLRPVSDAGAHRLTTRFYSAVGWADPVRALTRIQAELAETGDTDWPSFAVFGHDVCQDLR